MPKPAVRQQETFLFLFCILLILSLKIRLSTGRYWDRLFHVLPGSLPNDDANRNIYQLIESRGFIFERHYVKTEDEYILQMVRILNPFVKDRSTLKPILLHHGFQCTGTFWLVTRNGTLQTDGIYREWPDRNDTGKHVVGDTLGFVLAAKGFDVWLANYRGSIYSTNHTFLRTNSPEFWSFSMDEMIYYDIPAQMDYILLETKHDHLAYVGHSQGNLMMLALMSISDHYAKLVRPFIALSPVFYNSKVKGVLKNFSSMIDYLRSHSTLVPYSIGVKSFISNLCGNVMTRRLCFMILHQFTGSEMANIDQHRLSVYFSHIPMGSSSWNAAHLLQLYSRPDGQPSAFDLGSIVENLDRYAQPSPPIYNASYINCSHIALIYSINDWLNPLINVQRLRKDLGTKVIEDYQVPDPNYGHLDLVWGKNVGQIVNKKILEILSRY